MADERETDFSLSFKVLVVTSDEDCGENVDTLLSQCNFQVTRTGMGAEAIALLQDKDDFDFVMCDEHVADMDAIKLIGVIGFRMHKLVAYLSSGDYELINRAMRRAAQWYCIKPLKIKDLKCISEFLLWEMRSKLDAMRIEEGKCYDPVRREYFYPLEMMPADDVWPSEVHQKFVSAIKVLGKKATTESVMDWMKVDGLSKTDVANQLSRYIMQEITPHFIVPPVTFHK